MTRLAATVAATLAVLAPATAASASRGADDARKCANVTTSTASATGIRTKHVGCHIARGIAKTFINRTMCKLQRECTVSGYDCSTPETGEEDTLVFRETCGKGEENKVSFTAHL